MNIDTKSGAQALGEQRRAAKVFHRSCVAEGHKNLRHAASIHMPMALLADFSLAIGIVTEIAAKLRSQKELDRLRQLGRAELAAMGIDAIEEERVEINVVLDAIPGPEDVRSLMALGLKRARKDTAGRHFAGAGSHVQISSLVARLGGSVTVIDGETEPAAQATEIVGGDRANMPATIGVPTAVTGQTTPEEPSTEIASDTLSESGPAGGLPRSDAPMAASSFSVPAARPAPRLPVPPRLGVSDRPGILGGEAEGAGLHIGVRDNRPEPFTSG